MVDPRNILNIRYGDLGKIQFDYLGAVYTITEPDDVLLVGTGGAAAVWIARRYAYLLARAPAA